MYNTVLLVYKNGERRRSICVVYSIFHLVTSIRKMIAEISVENHKGSLRGANSRLQYPVY